MLATSETFPLIPSTRAARHTMTNECSGASTVRRFNKIRRSPALKRLWLFKFQELNHRTTGQYTCQNLVFHRSKATLSARLIPQEVGPGGIRPQLEEGRNAGAHPERKQIRRSRKTLDFKPATFRGFRNAAERSLAIEYLFDTSNFITPGRPLSSSLSFFPIRTQTQFIKLIHKQEVRPIFRL